MGLGVAMGPLYVVQCLPPISREMYSKVFTVLPVLRDDFKFSAPRVPALPSDPDVEGVEWRPLAPDARGPISPYLDIGPSLSVPQAPLWEERVNFWDSVHAKYLKN